VGEGEAHERRRVLVDEARERGLVAASQRLDQLAVVPVHGPILLADWAGQGAN
jgi:hypothetical protein